MIWKWPGEPQVIEKQQGSVTPATAFKGNRIWESEVKCSHRNVMNIFQKALFCAGEVHLSLWVCNLHFKAQKNTLIFFLQVDTIQILWELFSYKVRMELCVVTLLLSMDLILVSHFEWILKSTEFHGHDTQIIRAEIPKLKDDIVGSDQLFSLAVSGKSFAWNHRLREEILAHFAFYAFTTKWEVPRNFLEA